MSWARETFNVEQGSKFHVFGSTGYERFHDNWAPDRGRGAGFRDRIREWWHSLSPRERRIYKLSFIVGGCVLGFIFFIILPATLRDKGDSLIQAAPISYSPPSYSPPIQDRSPPPESTSPQSPSPAPDRGSSPAIIPTPSPGGQGPGPAIGDACTWNSLYLSRNVTPSAYTLNLTVHLGDHTMDAWEGTDHVQGSVAIDVTNKWESSCVVLHAQNMNITRVAYVNDGTTVTGEAASRHVMVCGCGVSAASEDFLKHQTMIHMSRPHVHAGACCQGFSALHATAASACMKQDRLQL